MPVPETHLRRIRRWCAAKVPVRSCYRPYYQIRFEHAVRGSNVTIFELRAPWEEGVEPEWTRRPWAQLRYDGSLWRLYWWCRSRRWRLDTWATPSEAPSPGPLLELLDDPYFPTWAY
jgi:hypothetical protein